jgi:hypothetical protein
MHLTINHASQFRDQFHKVGRGNQFSYDGLGILFDYFEEIMPDFELDVIAICCEFAESTPEQIADDYDVHIDADDDDIEAQVIQYLVNEGVFIGRTFKGTIVYQQF